MGNWTRREFDRDELPARCFLFAGDQTKKRIETILSHYETVLFHKHSVYEAFIVSNGISEDLLIFQAYGAPLVSDLSFILKDGGVREIIFIGTAFGIADYLQVGDYGRKDGLLI